MLQGLLYRTRCYLSGSMEFNTSGNLWREDVKEKLNSLNIIFLDPYKKPFITSLPEDQIIRDNLKKERERGNYDLVHDYFKQVRSDDLRCCDMADFAIVRFNNNIASIGTDEEITVLNRAKKPIFIFVDQGKNQCPLWLLGMLKHSYIYNSVDEVIKMIQDIDNETVKIDSSRWRLLKPELR